VLSESFDLILTYVIYFLLLNLLCR